ncbi:MAG: hypothetical protein ABIT76_04725 [Chthoniobacterales bacterium]
MRDENFRSSLNPILRPFCLSALLFLTSCAALLPKPDPTPTPGLKWKSIGGQVRYSDTRRTIVADVTIRAKNAREYSMEVSKAGAMLLKLDRAGTEGWASGPLAHWPFHGPVDKAPSHLTGWYRETTAALENPGAPQPAASGPGIQFRLQP